jgi:hypothetical protein
MHCICANTCYNGLSQPFFRALAKGMKERYKLKSWATTWKIVREYGPDILKLICPVETGVQIPNFMIYAGEIDGPDRSGRAHRDHRGRRQRGDCHTRRCNDVRKSLVIRLTSCDADNDKGEHEDGRDACNNQRQCSRCGVFRGPLGDGAVVVRVDENASSCRKR